VGGAEQRRHGGQRQQAEPAQHARVAGRPTAPARRPSASSVTRLTIGAGWMRGHGGGVRCLASGGTARHEPLSVWMVCHPELVTEVLSRRRSQRFRRILLQTTFR
jgi:hypothetical protein